MFPVANFISELIKKLYLIAIPIIVFLFMCLLFCLLFLAVRLPYMWACLFLLVILKLMTMDMATKTNRIPFSTSYRIRLCYQCQGSAECYCKRCNLDMCLHCKENHLIDNDTCDRYHDVVYYRDKHEQFRKKEPCKKHPNAVLKRYCLKCKLPFCSYCNDHLQHKTRDIGIACEVIRKQEKNVVHTIRNEILYKRCFFLEGIKNDIRNCQKRIFSRHLVQRIGKAIDTEICNINLSHKKTFLRSQILQKRRTIKKSISSIEKYEHAFEHAVHEPVKFLLYLKKTGIYQMKNKIHNFQGHTLPFVTEEIDVKDVVNLLSNALKIKIRKRQKISAQCKPRRCFQCQMKTEFFCKTCSHDLCLQCKERHVIDPNNIYHDVVIYRERYEFIRTERCVKHPDEIYRIYCQTCELPFCYKCKGCTKPQNIDIKSAYRSYRQKCKDIFQSIGYEALYISYFLLAEIKDDRRNCHTKLSNFQLEMATRAQSLQEHIITVVDDFKILHRRIMHCVQQRKRNNVCIEKYERRSEKVTQWPIKFLFFHKKTPFPKIRDTPNFTKQHPHSLYDELNMENLIKLLSENIITDTGTRHEYLLKLLPQPVLYRSITVEGVNGVLHISCVAPDKVWVNDLNNLLLINIEGEILHRLRDINSYTGSHTVNSVGDLIYIDKNNNITKLSNENKTMSTLVKKIESRVAPCVFCSPINDDLLVGITAKLPGISKLLRYSKTGKLIRTIQKNSRDQELYENPLYITENLNGDVIVSDSSRGVVVTNRIGRHLFSYTGYSEGSRIEPYGICTDVLSHILVFDRKSSKVQILDKDGNFLSNIQTTERGVRSPWSLCFNNKTHHLWVGSIYIFNEDAFFSNRVFICVYRYIEKRGHLKGNN